MSTASTPDVYAVLGAAGGVGSALARRLAQSGARVLLGGRRPEPLESLADEIGGAAMIVEGSDFEAGEDFCGRAASLGGELRRTVKEFLRMGLGAIEEARSLLAWLRRDHHAGLGGFSMAGPAGGREPSRARIQSWGDARGAGRHRPGSSRAADSRARG